MLRALQILQEPKSSKPQKSRRRRGVWVRVRDDGRRGGREGKGGRGRERGWTGARVCSGADTACIVYYAPRANSVRAPACMCGARAGTRRARRTRGSDVRTHTAFALTAGASARIFQVHATRRGCVVRCAAVYTRAEKRVVTEGDGTRACAMGTATPMQGDKRGGGRWERGGKGAGTRGENGDGEMGWQEAAHVRCWGTRSARRPHTPATAMPPPGAPQRRVRVWVDSTAGAPARDVGVQRVGKGTRGEDAG
ncbi:hypothetical protein B0H16DRAFT_911487 [Mycena metata]|uniref:Uncharacterized protein n=1 Tax=Mycena metata TaxID=1033252 RepID=A0AAD7N6M6_9AGAR|nr:hypothetical protein B0H16DRAFT_911487 [Mycena metata]